MCGLMWAEGVFYVCFSVRGRVQEYVMLFALALCFLHADLYFLLCVDLERPRVFLNLCTRVNVGSFRTHVHNKMKALSDFVWCVCVRRRSVGACVAVRSSCAPRGRVSRAVT